MKKFAVLILLALVVAAAGSYWYVTRETAAPSQDISEVTEEVITTGEGAIFEISQDSSTVEYNIGELLAGEPFTVEGKTSQVAGQAALDLTNLKMSEIGAIKINARTFVTDSDHRDTAVERVVLKAEEFELIEFVPTNLEPAVEAAGVGEVFSMKIDGDLTIAGTTLPASFETEVEVISNSQIKVTGQSEILHKDYGLTIPELPFIANVDENVVLKVDLVLNSK